MSNKLLKFGATWCGPCKFQDKILQEISDEHPELDIKLLDVDTDEGQMLCEKYGITSVPVIIIFDEDGDEQERFHGLTLKNTILKAMGVKVEEPEE